MASRGHRNKEILPKEALETENVLNSKLSLTSNALNYRKYKKSKILWIYTQSYAHHGLLVKDSTGKDLFICRYCAKTESGNPYQTPVAINFRRHLQAKHSICADEDLLVTIN